METSYSITSKCIVRGCTNDIEPYNVEKQKEHNTTHKFRLCHAHKKDKQYGRNIVIACILCGCDTGSIQKRICKLCRPHWQVLINRKNNERHKKPKGNCKVCGVHLSRDKYGQKYNYCSEKCSRSKRYQAWKERTRKTRYCEQCNVRLDPKLHKFKKRFCSYDCWGINYSLKVRAKYQSKKTLNTPLTIIKQ